MFKITINYKRDKSFLLSCIGSRWGKSNISQLTNSANMKTTYVMCVKN